MRMTFDEIKAELKGKPKKEQIQFVTKELKDYQQGLANERLKGNPPMTGIVGTYKTPEPEPEPTEEQKKARAELLQKQAKERKEREERQKKQEQKEQDLINKEVKKYTDLIAEIEARDEAHARKMRRNELKPFMCDRPLDWYAKNIKNQKLFFDVLTEIRKHEFDKLTSDDFFNILYFQIENIKDKASAPFQIVDDLQAIPLQDDERLLLYNLLLKSLGDISEKNKYYLILMGIQEMVKALKNNSVEAETEELSDRYKIPMDNTFSSAEKALAHFYEHGQVSHSTASAIIKVNNYKRQSDGELLTKGGFVAEHSKVTGLLDEYLNATEVLNNDLKLRNLKTSLEKLNNLFIKIDRPKTAEKITTDLQILSLKPKKVVKKLVK